MGKTYSVDSLRPLRKDRVCHGTRCLEGGQKFESTMSMHVLLVRRRQSVLDVFSGMASQRQVERVE